MKEPLLKLILWAYWQGRRYQQHVEMFGKENADSKPYLSNSVKIKKEAEQLLNNLKF